MAVPRDHGFLRSGLHTRIRTAGQRCNILFVGDSTFNRGNQHTAGNLSSYTNAVIHGWRTGDVCAWNFMPWANGRHGQVMVNGSTGNWAHSPTRRANGADSSGGILVAGTFAGGHRQFGLEEMVDRAVSSATAGTSTVATYRLIDTVPFNAFHTEVLNFRVGLWSEEDGCGDVEVWRGRSTAGGSTSAAAALETLDIAVAGGSEGLLLSDELTLAQAAVPANFPYPQVQVRSAEAAAEGKTLVFAGARIYAQGALTGFEMSVWQADGARIDAFLDPSDADVGIDEPDEDNSFRSSYPLTRDVHLESLLELRGWPNVVWICLGTNQNALANTDPARCRRHFEKIMQRVAAAYVSADEQVPEFVLQTPPANGTVTASNHDAYADILYDLSRIGVSSRSAPNESSFPSYPAIGAEKIHFVNTRKALEMYGANGTLWDAAGVLIPAGSGGTGLNDNVHPKYEGAVGVMNTVVYDQVLANPTRLGSLDESVRRPGVARGTFRRA